MKVSIIIVNYNTLSYTQQCIDSIFEQTKDVEFEVILVDNNSKDASAEYFVNDNRIKFVQSGENLGFGRANNLGYKHISPSSKYVFLLNSDTKLLNNAVKIFYDYMESAPQNISSCGTQLLNANEERFSGGGSCGGNFTSIYKDTKSLISSFGELILRSKLSTEAKVFKEPPFEIDYIVGADLFIRREVIDKSGLFDSDFFMYFEENEMQYRYSKAGYKQMIIAGPKIIHYVKASSKGGVKASFFLMLYNGKFLYFKKRYNRVTYLFFRCLQLLRIPYTLKANFTKEEKKKIIKMFFGSSSKLYL